MRPLTRRSGEPGNGVRIRDQIDRQLVLQEFDVAPDRLRRVARETQDVADIDDNAVLLPELQHLAVFPDLVLPLFDLQQVVRVEVLETDIDAVAAGMPTPCVAVPNRRRIFILNRRHCCHRAFAGACATSPHPRGQEQTRWQPLAGSEVRSLLPSHRYLSHEPSPVKSTSRSLKRSLPGRYARHGGAFQRVSKTLPAIQARFPLRRIRPA